MMAAVFLPPFVRRLLSLHVFDKAQMFRVLPWSAFLLLPAVRMAPLQRMVLTLMPITIVCPVYPIKA